MNDRLKHALDYAKKRDRAAQLRWVYVIKCGEYYKVGIAGNVKHRLANLQCATPYPIELVKSWQCSDAAQQERAIHGLLWKFHERGEWFRLPIEIVLLFGSCTASPVKALRQALK